MFVNYRIKSENIQLKQERDRYVTEIADISDVGKRREQEFLRLEEDMKKIGEELGKANAAKVINKSYFRKSSRRNRGLFRLIFCN